MPQITLKEQSIAYSIRESTRASRPSLRIDKQGLQVIVPTGFPVDSVDSWLVDRTNWILKNLKRFEVNEAKPPVQPYQTGKMLSFLGKPIQLEIITKQKGKGLTVSLDQQVLRLSVPKDAKLPPNAIKDVVENWYRWQAQDYIPTRVAELAQQHGFQYANITIKNQKTRWGSCSTKSNLNFNLRLMMTPPEAIDYVIIHELCHLLEMNHDKKFWKLVKQYYPSYRKWVKWLKEHEKELQF